MAQRPVVPPKLMVLALASLVLCAAAIIAHYVRLPDRGIPQAKLPTVDVTIAGHHLTVERATTKEQREQGLAYRPSMAVNEGMLLEYPLTQPQNFWTHGMQFPVDVLFLNGETVVDYEDDVLPPVQIGGQDATETTLENANAVLLISSGLAKEWGIGIKSKVMIGH